MSLDYLPESLERAKPVTCDNCATCCKAGRFIIGLTDAEVKELEAKGALLTPQGRKKRHILLGVVSRRAATEIRQDYVMANDCPNLVDDRCVVYGQESPVRPGACQEFTPGSINCLEARFKEGIGDVEDYYLPLIDSGQDSPEGQLAIYKSLVAYRAQQQAGTKVA